MQINLQTLDQMPSLFGKFVKEFLQSEDFGTFCVLQARSPGPKLEANLEASFAGRPQFGSVTVWGWKGSSGSGFRFWRFLCKRGFSVFQYRLTGREGSGSGFGSWKTVPAVPVPVLVSGKTVPTFPVPGSGSVPEPPCFSWDIRRAKNNFTHKLASS